MSETTEQPTAAPEEIVEPVSPETAPPSALRPPRAKLSRQWLPWLVPAAVVVGGLVGAGIVVGATDPKNSDAYRSVVAEVSQAKTQVEQAENRADGAEAIASQASAAAASQSASLAAREASVAARESTVSATEQQIAANSVSEGTWTVGVDIEPGTYRTKSAVSGDCYWEITRTGSNGGDIIENDIVTGGFATVTLSAGQDFTNNRCGTFVKQ